MNHKVVSAWILILLFLQVIMPTYASSDNRIAEAFRHENDYISEGKNEEKPLVGGEFNSEDSLF